MGCCPCSSARCRKALGFAQAGSGVRQPLTAGDGKPVEGRQELLEWNPDDERMARQLRHWLVVILALTLGWWILWPRPALGLESGAMASELMGNQGASLFAEHCVGCHLNGGNVIRRGKTLRLAALRRAGLEGPEAVSRVAAVGQGQMGGYGEVLGPGGPEAVGAWVWQQALADWPKSAPSPKSDQNLTQEQT